MPLVEQQNLQTTRLQHDSLELTEGSYQVEIRDSEHKTLTAMFQAVPKSELPQLPPEFDESYQQSTLDANAKATLFAAWLLEEKKEEWEFEAYQLVVPLADTYYPALLIKEQLEYK